MTEPDPTELASDPGNASADADPGAGPPGHESESAGGEDGAAIDAEVGEVIDLQEVVSQRDEYLDSLRRLQADFDNYRKRTRSDIEMEVGRATEKLVNELLPVLDAMEMSLTHEVNPDDSSLAKLHDQLLSALEKQGLERLHPLNSPFDPSEAEAVLHEPAEETDDANAPIVSEVLRAGYRWRNRVMRAAMVKVRG